MSAFLGRRCSAGILLVFAAAAAAASPADRPGDYAYAIPVTESGSQAVVQLLLPRTVYLEARSADLRDLRLFDASGTPLPFALLEQVRQAQENRSTAAATVFPVRAPAGAAPRLPDGLQIRTDENGAVISVTAPAARSGGDVLDSLILDLQRTGAAANTNETRRVDAFAFTLPPGLNSYNARIALDASNDLQRWEALAETTLSWLVNSQGSSVRKDRIAFAPRSFRFARIRWLEGTPIEFSAINAQFVVKQQASEQWDSVVLQASPGTAGQDIVYDAPIAVPAESLGLELHGHNVVLPALVGLYRKTAGRGSGSTTSVDLRVVANTTFFQLTQNGQRRVSGDIDIALTNASQWVVRPQVKVSDRPGLRLRWKPASMIFIAGKGPYTLAFGRAGTQSSQVPVSQVAPGFSMPELAMLEQAKAGDPVRQNNAQAGRGGQAGELDDVMQDRSIWLWTLLVCGVAALGAMAWKLSRQLKEGGADQPPA
jgi:hypothetical protein